MSDHPANKVCIQSCVLHFRRANCYPAAGMNRTLIGRLASGGAGLSPGSRSPQPGNPGRNVEPAARRSLGPSGWLAGPAHQRDSGETTASARKRYAITLSASGVWLPAFSPHTLVSCSRTPLAEFTSSTPPRARVTSRRWARSARSKASPTRVSRRWSALRK